MNLLYALPWLLWFLWFVVWEAWGFRSNHDKWPTLSQLIKGWEDHTWVTVPTGTQYVQRRGIIAWTWQRWLVAVGIPILGVFLEAHWVWEWPF
jgi:hypothetical protein